jgi:signal transduction histidine kinase
MGLLAVSVAIYNGAAALKTASLTLPDKLWWYKLEFLGSATLPSIAMVLALAYLGQERWLTAPVLAVLVGIPGVAIPLIIANPGAVMITEPTLVEVGGLQILEHGFPPLFVMAAAWGEGITLLAALLVGASGLFGMARRTPALLLSAALGLPYAALLLKTLQVYPPGGQGVNLTPAFASGTLVIVGLAIVRYRLFGLLPMGRSRAFDVMSDGYVLVDTTGTIVDANEAARILLGEARLASRAVSGVIPNLSAIEGAANPTGTVPQRGTAEQKEMGDHKWRDPITFPIGERVLQAQSSPIRDGATTIGRVFILRDITALKQREQVLKAENKRLDRFASVLSHDLRNPLQAAKTRLKVAKHVGGGDPEGHLSDAETALERMTEIIEDMLLLTWIGRGVAPEDLEAVELEEVAREAWGSVVALEATFGVQSSAKIKCHRRQFRRLLENLFRNAVEHGGEAVSVSVGILPKETLTHGDPPDERSSGGFFVEDNGPGIPEKHRKKVLEDGYSSRPEGTGLGLSIVQGIAESHGWSVSICEPAAPGRESGALFEFQGAGMPDR